MFEEPFPELVMAVSEDEDENLEKYKESNYINKEGQIILFAYQ